MQSGRQDSDTSRPHSAPVAHRASSCANTTASPSLPILSDVCLLHQSFYNGHNYDSTGAELTQYRLQHFIHTDGSGCEAVEFPLVKKIQKEPGDNLLLNAVVINLPGTGAVEKSDTLCASSERQVHGQAITANQTTMDSNVAQMLK